MLQCVQNGLSFFPLPLFQEEEPPELFFELAYIATTSPYDELDPS